MTESEVLLDLPGAQNIIEWFGRWPSFHDAEVVSLKLNRSGKSEIQIHTFSMTEQLDSGGHYITEKHAVIMFQFTEVIDTELLGFNHQNVLSGLIVQKDADKYVLKLGGCYGLEGYLSGSALSMEIKPGIPPGSIYCKTVTGGASIP